MIACLSIQTFMLYIYISHHQNYKQSESTNNCGEPNPSEMDGTNYLQRQADGMKTTWGVKVHRLYYKAYICS